MNPQITPLLDRVEQQFHAVSALLASDDAAPLADAGAALQSLAVELAQCIGPVEQLQFAGAADIARIQSLAERLQLLRDNLSRRHAYVQQALKIVMPTPSKATYGQASSPFGGVVQQSGQFKVLAA